ncbi:MAG: ATP-binding protein [Chloroflexota bacterium]
MNNNRLDAAKRLDWLLLGIRLLFLGGMTLVVLVWRNQAQQVATVDDQSLIMAAGIGVAAIFVIGLCTLIPAFYRAIPVLLMISDWVMAGMYIHLTEANPTMSLIAIGFLGVSATARLGTMAGSFYLVILVAVTFGLMIYHSHDGNLNQDVNFDLLLDQYGLTMVGIILLALGIGLWTVVQYRLGYSQQAQLNQLANQREDQMRKMRERAQAVVQMTQALTASLQYERVLEAALDIGDVSLRNVANQRVMSLVMLFRADERLYIAHSRGLRNGFHDLTFPANEGIIGKALDECIPVIGKDSSRDPVLSEIPGFRQVRSLLCIPLRAHYDNFGILVFGSVAANAFDPDHIDILNAIGTQTTVALQNAVLYRNLMDEKDRLIAMEEDGRKALVRDLHDVPTQTIAAVAMRTRIAMRLVERDPDQVLGELAEIEKMSLRATEEIRHVLFKLRPLALESQGLVAALQQLAEKMLTTYKQAVYVKLQPEIERHLDDTQQGALFYLIEEAVNNARKYAEAERITVQGVIQGEMILVRIADNGKGFDANEVAAGYHNRGSFGMVNMRERAELLDGTLTLKSVPGRGTTITVTIPIDLQRVHDDNGARAQLTMTKLAVAARTNLSRMLQG